MAKKKSDSEKLVYISLGCVPEEGEPIAGIINYGAGYSKKKTKWYSHEINLAQLNRYAAAYDYLVLEGIGCYTG